MFTPLILDKTLKNWHTCSMSPYPAVDGGGGGVRRKFWISLRPKYPEKNLRNNILVQTTRYRRFIYFFFFFNVTIRQRPWVGAHRTRVSKFRVHLQQTAWALDAEQIRAVFVLEPACRCLAFLSREGFSNFFPRRLASNCAYLHTLQLYLVV